ncbi:MAG: hypothetical protein IPK79_00175 [Vampirovibrionales bacterium]|nr:hypothetical protein [Vampirovibrionales bacterium]
MKMSSKKRAILMIVLAALLLALYLPARACCETTPPLTPDPNPPISSTRSPELFLPLVAGGALIGIEIVTPTPTNTATPTATSTPIPPIHPTLTIVTPTP